MMNFNVPFTPFPINRFKVKSTGHTLYPVNMNCCGPYLGIPLVIIHITLLFRAFLYQFFYLIGFNVFFYQRLDLHCSP